MSEANRTKALSICLMCDEVLRFLGLGEERETTKRSISRAIEFLDDIMVGAEYLRTSKSEAGFEKWLEGLSAYRHVLESSPSLRGLQPEEFERKIQLYRFGLRELRSGTLDRDDLRTELRDLFYSLDKHYANGAYPDQERNLMVA